MISQTLATLKHDLRTAAGSTDVGFNAGKDSPIVARIKVLAAAVEAETPTPDPSQKLDLLDGRWRLLYSSFGLDRNTTLRRLSFATLPREAKISVTGVFQEVDHATGRYDNHVTFTTGAGDTGVHVTSGRFVPDATVAKRLTITFTANAVKANSPGRTEDTLRSALGLGPEEPLHAPLNFSGWSDVTYLDSDMRLMRGNAGNLYVLTREI